MRQNHKSADSKSSKKLSEQEITKRSSPPLHFLSKFLYLCSVIFIFIACDTAVSSPSPDLSSWTQLRANNHFSTRSGHSSVVLKNSAGIDEIYVMGGVGGTYRDDIWKSADKGLTWTKVETTTKFPVRAGHSSVVIESDMYVIGGSDGSVKDDIWKSANGGLTWTEVKTTGTSTKFPARAYHSSVVIGSEIYVIGGYDGTNRLNDVWKSANRGLAWTEVEVTTKFPARDGHSSVVLKNSAGIEEIYVIGGFDDTNRLNDVWKSVDGIAWIKVATTTKFPTRSGHSSVVIGSAVYVIGGFDGTNSLNDVWKSANKGLTWTEVAMTKFPARLNHSSVVIGSDIYVIGGLKDFSNQFNDVWKSTNGVEWISVVKPDTTLFSARSSHSSVVIGSDMYVIGGSGGSSVYLDDVWKSSNGITWTQVATTKFSARNSHSSVVIGSEIYVIGGFNSSGRLNDVWKSANGGLTWTEVKTTGTSTKFSARSRHSSVVIGSDIYVIGGYDGTNRFNDVWKSADEGLTWTEVATTETKFSKRQSHSSVVIGSAVYVIGGFGGGNIYFDDVWKSADEGLTWTEVATTTKFPTRSNHSSVVIGSDIYVIGGNDGNNRLNDVWKSTDEGLTWTEVATTTKFSARSDHSSVVRGSAVYVIGGFSNFGQLNDVWVSR